MQNWLMASVFGYPVASEQITILNLFGLRGVFWLWVLRFLSLITLILSLYLWFGYLKLRANQNLAKISGLLIFISPLFLILWLVYPLICLKILIFTVFLNFGFKRWHLFLVLGVSLILFNYFILKDRPAIFFKFNLKDAQSEVTKRISSEDSLLESISVPLWLRRATYNKYFFTYKQVVAEVIPFFDFESIFFQEINPLEQKSIVIFYWPEIFLFILGLYFLVNSNNKKLNNFLLTMIGLAWVDFVFSEGAVFKRLVLVILPISVIVGLGFYNLYLGAKKISLIMVIFILFGFVNSIYDLSMRGDYWLDNRPLAFEFWYRQINKLDLDKFDKVYISSLVGEAKPYCYFYLGSTCDDDKFVFKSFDLQIEKNVKTAYAGFGGEFVGSRFKNDISSQWVQVAQERGIDIVANKSLRDTIANQYGNDIGLGVVQ